MARLPERDKPPDDISPHAFFTSWVPQSVDADDSRRQRLGDTQARLLFELRDAAEHERHFTLHIEAGRVRGEPGAHADPDRHVQVDVLTWRALNRGDISAPKALLERKVTLHGNLVLALKLHLILG
ncbi:MAG: SCP2 sterol-binding domain-containing protein [Myxococcota bacterium]